jgi:putative hydrolase of the HAD superfamily
VIPTLRRLAEIGLKLGIITNGSVTSQDAKIAGLGLIPLMDTILVSEREGLRKPDPAIFHRGTDQLGVTPDAAWFVGDHPDADVRGAHEAGLTAVLRRSWVTTSEHADYIVSSLDELIPLIRAARTTTRC